MRTNTNVYGAPETTNDNAQGDTEPPVPSALGAAAAGMAELRSQIQAKTAQDWHPHPWEPLNPNDTYAGAEATGMK